MNIPIYRAKKIDSNEYVEGFLTKCRESYFIESGSSHCDEIDTTTLSIHFPDMLDSEDKEIFASLSESGKGGDIMSYEPAPKETDLNGVVTYERGRISIDKEGFMPKFELLKVTGIKD